MRLARIGYVSYGMPSPWSRDGADDGAYLSYGQTSQCAQFCAIQWWASCIEHILHAGVFRLAVFAPARNASANSLAPGARCGCFVDAVSKIVTTGCAIIGLLLVAAGFSVAGLTSNFLAIGIFHGLSQQVFLIATVESRSRGESLYFARQNLERAGIALAISCGIGALFESAAAVLLAEAMVSYLLTLKIMSGVFPPSPDQNESRCAFGLAAF